MILIQLMVSDVRGTRRPFPLARILPTEFPVFQGLCLTTARRRENPSRRPCSTGRQWNASPSVDQLGGPSAAVGDGRHTTSMHCGIESSHTGHSSYYYKEREISRGKTIDIPSDS